MHSRVPLRLTMAPQRPKAAGEYQDLGVAMCTVAPMPPTPRKLRYLMVPVGEGRGLMRWAMVSGMLMVRGEMWAWTGFTGDSSTSCFSRFSLDRAVNVILMFVLGNLNVHLQRNSHVSVLPDGGARGPLGAAKLPRSPLPVQLTCHPQLRNETTKAARDFNVLANKTSFRLAELEKRGQ